MEKTTGGLRLLNADKHWPMSRRVPRTCPRVFPTGSAGNSQFHGARRLKLTHTHEQHLRYSLPASPKKCPPASGYLHGEFGKALWEPEPNGYGLCARTAASRGALTRSSAYLSRNQLLCWPKRRLAQATGRRVPRWKPRSILPVTRSDVAHRACGPTHPLFIPKGRLVRFHARQTGQAA